MIVKLREGSCPALIATVRLPSLRYLHFSILSPAAEWSCSLDSSCPCSRLVPGAGPNIEIYVRSENVIILVSSSRNSHTRLIISLVTGHSVSVDIVSLMIMIHFGSQFWGLPFWFLFSILGKLLSQIRFGGKKRLDDT